ncbi:hypothetical protein PMI17_04957 [Pantoea sp. GM01]|nr:hypothetical protein PMI17_04957 [Pantoea sp. GM01]
MAGRNLNALWPERNGGASSRTFTNGEIGVLALQRGHKFFNNVTYRVMTL